MLFLTYDLISLKIKIIEKKNIFFKSEIILRTVLKFVKFKKEIKIKKWQNCFVNFSTFHSTFEWQEPPKRY